MAAQPESRRPLGGLRIAAAAFAAVVLAASWMVFSLVAGKAGLGKALTAQSSGEAAVAQAVTRTGITKQGSKVQVLFGVPEYYERTGQKEIAAEVEPQKYLVFIVAETDHDALAPAPLPTLMADGKPLSVPVKERLLSASDHHRTRQFRFARLDANGQRYIPAGTHRLEMSWPDIAPVHRADHSLGQALYWDWPVTLPAETAGSGLSVWAFLVLTAGLFAALSPCLIQLTLYYLSALAGTTADGRSDRRKILSVAGLFVAGISSAYVLGGVLAGYLGRTIQVSNVLGEYGRWVAVGAGVMIVGMGFRSVLTANEPLICRMPLPFIGRLARWKMGPAVPFLMGFLISLGCLQCFGGAIFASLLLYVGSLGSPGLGGLMLFLFSLGVAVPFLAAALAWERVAARLASLERTMQAISLVSGILMMSFGVLMVLDRFHWVSGVVINWLPFLRT